MTLIEQISASGQRRRRCDARCYNAKRPKCHCICDGRNHGVGLERAMARTQEIAKELLGNLSVPAEARQGHLSGMVVLRHQKEAP